MDCQTPLNGLGSPPIRTGRDAVLTQVQKQTNKQQQQSHLNIPYQNSVTIHDCVQSVGNGQDSAIRELVTYCLLNYSISPAREESQPYLTSNGSQSATLSIAHSLLLRLNMDNLPYKPI